MSNIKELYNKLYNDSKSLLSEETQILVEDFQTRVTSKIDINNAGKYIIEANCPDYIFSGFAIIKQSDKILYNFQVLLNKKFTVTINDDMSILLVNCTANLIEKTNKADSVVASKIDFNDVSNVVEQLEKIQKLKDAGTVNEEEFLTLKKKILS